ncbi:uncharacterized protein SCHCODRAFT_01096813 [Schizophyllum commune H4-8]|nr:uncharacterized protein SCHCODRAFT_01096813 [Schizophyllum commune H4-8]KAI5891694.1 hypothetical protein SCHCODRAFT_01096813 [Schizophyllum commune H4-8]
MRPSSSSFLQAPYQRTSSFQHRANARPPPPARCMRQLASSSSSYCKTYAPTRFLLLFLQDLRANSLPCANSRPCANSLPPLPPSSSAAPTRFLFLLPQALRQLASSRQLAPFLLRQAPRQLASSPSSFKHHANACPSSFPQVLCANSLPLYSSTTPSCDNFAPTRPSNLAYTAPPHRLPSNNNVSKVLLPMEDTPPVARDGFVSHQGSLREAQMRRPPLRLHKNLAPRRLYHPRPSCNKPNASATLTCHPQAPARGSALPTRAQDLT